MALGKLYKASEKRAGRVARKQDLDKETSTCVYFVSYFEAHHEFALPCLF